MRKTIVYEKDADRRATVGVLLLLSTCVSILASISVGQYVEKDSFGHMDASMGTRIDSDTLVFAHVLLNGSICRKSASTC